MKYDFASASSQCYSFGPELAFCGEIDPMQTRLAALSTYMERIMSDFQSGMIPEIALQLAIGNFACRLGQIVGQ